MVALELEFSACCPMCGRSLPHDQGQNVQFQGGAGGEGEGDMLVMTAQAVPWLCQAPWPKACPSPRASFIPCSFSGDKDTECVQESAPCTVAPGHPWGSPASSPEPSSPESGVRGSDSLPSPVSSREGSLRLQGHPPGSVLPEWTLDAPSPSFLETDGVEPGSLEKEEAGEAPNQGKEGKLSPARTTEAGARQPDAYLTSAKT